MTRLLRLEWPQYQGGDPDAVAFFTSGLDEEGSRLAYGVGGSITALLAPAATTPSARIDVANYDPARSERDGVFEKDEILRQNGQALDALRAHDAERVVTLGGTCGVSTAPFSYLAGRYADDLVVVWLDSHPDCNVPHGENKGFNTMALSHLIGTGDAEILAQLPSRVAASRVVLAGTHGWADQDPVSLDGLGLHLVRPAPEQTFVDELTVWIAQTGCSKAAVHFDLDVIDSNDIAFGMAPEPGGISSQTALAAITAIAERFDLVGLTVAEYVPREAMRLRSILSGLPLLVRSNRQ